MTSDTQFEEIIASGSRPHYINFDNSSYVTFTCMPLSPREFLMAILKILQLAVIALTLEDIRCIILAKKNDNNSPASMLFSLRI